MNVNEMNRYLVVLEYNVKGDEFSSLIIMKVVNTLLYETEEKAFDGIKEFVKEENSFFKDAYYTIDTKERTIKDRQNKNVYKYNIIEL